MFVFKRILLFLCFCSAVSCGRKDSKNSETAEAYTKSDYEARTLSSSFKDYWFTGEAEISSYKLQQPRYGEIREGNAVLIFVKEDFLPKAQVKADSQEDRNVPVLKLNQTKNFVTGIYPYSIMSSTFYPLLQKSHAIKVSSGVQEWCGQQYLQLNNREDFEVMLHSYFEREADQHFNLKKNILENELWTQLRVDPKDLPTGKQMLIPDLSYNRLKHTKFKAYEAQISLTDTTYSINYTTLRRKLLIHFEPELPYRITGWEESYPSGSGDNAPMMTAKAVRVKTLKTAYWEQNAKQFEFLRDTLML